MRNRGGEGCLEGRGGGSEKAVQEGGGLEEEYDSHINTATSEILSIKNIIIKKIKAFSACFACLCVIRSALMLLML